MDRHGKGEREGRRGSLAERLDRHSELKARVETLLDVVEDAGDDLEKANAAEQRVIEELRRMGQDVLRGWARNQELKKSQGLRAKEAKACKKAKKNSTGSPGLGK